MGGRPTLVTVEDVPEHEIAKGLPSAAVVWQAETMFLQRQEELYPLHDVVSWEARYLKPDGPILSQFEITMPDQEG